MIAWTNLRPSQYRLPWMVILSIFSWKSGATFLFFILKKKEQQQSGGYDSLWKVWRLWQSQSWIQSMIKWYQRKTEHSFQLTCVCDSHQSTALSWSSSGSCQWFMVPSKNNELNWYVRLHCCVCGQPGLALWNVTSKAQLNATEAVSGYY